MIRHGKSETHHHPRWMIEEDVEAPVEAAIVEIGGVAVRDEALDEAVVPGIDDAQDQGRDRVDDV